MKALLAAILAVILLNAPLTSQTNFPLGRVTNSIGRFVQGTDTQCTAFAVTPRVAVTASHCVAPGEAFYDENRVQVIDTGIGLDDVAIMRADRDLWKPLQVGKAPKVGDAAMGIGYGLNAPKLLAFGGNLMVLDMPLPGGDGDNQDFYSFPAMRGMSGGPIINIKGQVVGMLQGTFDPDGPLQTVSTSTRYEPFAKRISVAKSTAAEPSLGK